jgi:acetyl-CoA C-acetyltransferase
MKGIVIAGAVRTSIGDFGGVFKDLSASQLAACALRETAARTGIDPAAVDEALLGNVFQAGQKGNPARQAWILAGFPVEVPALTLNNQCASGMRAITAAAEKVGSGDAELLVAGGMESMTNTPYLLRKARFGYRLGNEELLDHMYYDGLVDAFHNYHMGVTAENLAEKHGISREEQDLLACESHRRAARAVREGRFRDEIVPVVLKKKDGTELPAATDEHPREDTTPEKLGKLRPAFKPGGTVTAGNASGINDGAAALVVTSEAGAARRRITPQARIVASAIAGVPPEIMGWGPVPAVGRALERAGLKLSDIGLVELNEAFAAQALAVIKGLGIDPEITNVNGSGIGLGHPVGATGCRIVVSLVHEMARRNVRYGLATLCQGGGMGSAIILENLAARS